MNELFPKPSQPLKTRAVLKRELLSAIPQGEELNFLQLAQKNLDESRQSLQALRTEKAKLMRQISIRKRKIQDWKSKIPRTSDPSHQATEAELQRLGDAPCYAVATVEKGSTSGQRLVFDKPFWRGLTGLGGFEKAWLILNRDSQGAVAHGLGLVLVDLIHVDVAKGVVDVEGLEDGCIGVHVLDIKPYLAYCEAFPEDKETAEGDAKNGQEDSDEDEDDLRQPTSLRKSQF